MKQTARLEARVPVDLYASLKQAADLQGRTITEYVINSLRDTTRRTIEDATMMKLSADDQRRFAESLIDPPEPNESLKRAARRHRELVEVR